MNALVYAGMTQHHQKRFRDSIIRMSTLSCIETIPQIIKAASVCFDVPQEDITGIRRTSELVKLRILIVKTIRSKYNNISLKTIGGFINRDHSSVIYLLGKYSEYSKHDTGFQDMVLKFTKYRLAI